MKISKTFRLSEEAVSVLDSQANATQFLEYLILTGPPQAGGGLTEQDVLRILKTELSSQDKPGIPDSLQLATGAAFVPKPPDPETGYPCCSGRAPCKHWVWDDTEVLYKNTLTGKTREV